MKRNTTSSQGGSYPAQKQQHITICTSKKKPILVGCLFACTYLVSGLAYADDTTDLKTMVITPSRIEQDIKQVGNSISVITKEEIEEKKFQNLADILRSVEGLQVTQSGGFGGITSIFLRGSSSSQVLVLVDSIPVNEVTSGQFDFSDFNTLSIERIEILRGAQSVAYGSSALGGVINIITSKDTKKTEATANVEAGSYGTQNYQAGTKVNILNEGDKNVSASLSARWFDTDNISQADKRNGNREHDPYNNKSVNATVNGSIDKTKLSGNFRYTQGRSQLDNYDFVTGAIDAPDYEQQKEMYQSSVHAETTFGIWTPKVLLGYNQENYIGKDPETTFNNYQLKSNTTSLQQQNLFKFNEYVSSLFGYGYQQNDGSSVGNFSKSRYVNGLFTEQFITPVKGTNLTLGARHDDDSTFGSEKTYRASLAQEVEAIDSRLHTSYGTGYRAPSFSDLYFPNFSNPNLNPEKSRGFDVGLGTTFSTLRTDVTYFDTTYKDLISFSDVTFLPENIGRARTRGLESKVSVDTFFNTELTLSYTYLDARDITKDVALPRRARHQSGLTFTNTFFDKLLLRSDILLIADRFDSGMTSMDDYLIVSGTARYEATKNILPYIRVQNLFNRDYQEIRGYGTLGSSVFAGIDVKL